MPVSAPAVRRLVSQRCARGSRNRRTAQLGATAEGQSGAQRSGEKHYGIALPTAESVMTEQAFSQFALSGGANVFDANGNVKIDTPEMSKALAFYRALAANTMPGSNDVMEIKDAFMNGSAPMAVYSTYILPAVYKDGNPANPGFVVPTKNHQPCTA